jgi:hypothetical protein
LPFGGALTAGLIGAGGSLLGGIFGGGANKRLSNTEADALKQQQQQQAIEFAQMQELFQKLAPFFSSYMQSGSPFLSQIQRAGAEQTAQGANNAAGQIRQVLGSSGLGFGPSGTTAAALGGLGAETGRTASSNYLTNLLNNEMVKFQAASGLGNLTSLMKPGGITTPNFAPPSGLPGAIQGAGNALAGIPFGSNAGPAINNASPNTLGIPAPGTVPTSNMPFPPFINPTSSSPTTQGFGWGF